MPVYTFTLTGDATAQLELDSQPTPFDFTPDLVFRIENVSGVFNGQADTMAALNFYNATNDFGGFELASFTFETLTGPQLYSGPESAPTFLLGTYELKGFATKAGNYTLTISAAAGAVPEPTTWSMAIAGFGIVGGVLRLRPQRRAARSSCV